MCSLRCAGVGLGAAPTASSGPTAAQPSHGATLDFVGLTCDVECGADSPEASSAPAFCCQQVGQGFDVDRRAP
eukprot:6748745-Alexandrium_andersonii.AAC.1